MPTASQLISRPKPLRDQVYECIVSMILDMEIRPGDSFTEPMLIERLGVSRTPIREALLRLDAEGILSSSLARGFKLRALDDKEVADSFPILGSLEMLAIRELPDTLKAPMMKKLKQVASDLSSTTDPVERWSLDSQFHQLLVEASGNKRLLDITKPLRVLLGRYELSFMAEAEPDHTHADTQHMQIVAALESDERLQAARIDREHWDNEMEAILAWMKQ